MGGSPSCSHIKNQHVQGTTVVGNLGWIASFEMHKLNLACPGLVTLRTCMDGPDDFLELMDLSLNHEWMQHSLTYPFNCGEHWVSIGIWVQINIDHIRISCIVVVIVYERPGNVVLV